MLPKGLGRSSENSEMMPMAWPPSTSPYDYESHRCQHPGERHVRANISWER